MLQDQIQPDVIAEIESNSYGLLLNLSTPRPRVKEKSIKMARPDIVRGQNEMLSARIAEFQQPFRATISSRPQIASQQLARLADAAAEYLFNVFEDAFDSLNDLTNFFVSACPSWQTGVPRSPIVHAVSSFADYFPWEFLPVFNPLSEIRAATRMELEDICRRFLGFGAIVERSAFNVRSMNPVLDATGSLPIRMIYEATYQGAQMELFFLRGWAPSVCLEGPYPQPAGSVGSVLTLAAQLRDPTIRTDGKHGNRPDQIVHFSCHCETPREKPSSDYLIRLSAEDGMEQTIRLGDLISDMFRAPVWADANRKNRMPLIFLNACGSSLVDPHSAVSFFKLFADNHNRGFIGTMANVPDKLAARFSRQFYIELFSGCTASEALYRAKWNLIHDYSNPLGILYGLYGDADLQVMPILNPVSI